MKEFTDISAPHKVVKTLLEADVQSACVSWARKRGYWARKFSSPANRSVPDYLFAGSAYCDGPQNSLKFFAEFKAPGKKATDNQLDEQKHMRAAGWEGLQECDSIAQFQNWVSDFERAHAYKH